MRKRFANRAEEAAWWEANEETLASAFEKDLNDGYVGPCTVVVTGDAIATKIRMCSRDVAKVRIQAAAHGLRYQTYLKMIIHEVLNNAKSSRRTTAS
jgi:hypothetical protein